MRHLIDTARLANVSLGVVPARPDRKHWPVEDFWLFDNSRVNVELVSGYLTVTQPREIAVYADTFARLADLAVYGPRRGPGLRPLQRALPEALRLRTRALAGRSATLNRTTTVEHDICRLSCGARPWPRP